MSRTPRPSSSYRAATEHSISNTTATSEHSTTQHWIYIAADSSRDATEHTSSNLNPDTVTRGSSYRSRMTHMASDPSDATEHAIVAINPHVIIGPDSIDWRTSGIPHEMLALMATDIENHTHMPVTINGYMEKNRCEMLLQVHQTRRVHDSFSNSIEGVSRCVAAFHHATEAAEYDECSNISTRIYERAYMLRQRIPNEAVDMQHAFIDVLHAFIKNRATNMSLTSTMQRSQLGRYVDPFWYTVDVAQREPCRKILEQCSQSVRYEAMQMKNEMKALLQND